MTRPERQRPNSNDGHELLIRDLRTLGAFLWDAGASAWTVSDAPGAVSEASASLNGTVIELDPAGIPKVRPTGRGASLPFWVKVS